MPALPALRRLCQCWQCYDTTSTDPVTGLPVKGVYLKQSQYDIHQLQATEASPTQSTTVLATAPPLSSSPQRSESVSASDDRVLPSADPPSADPEIPPGSNSEQYIGRLRSFKIRLEQSPIEVLARDLQKNPPLFVPTDTGYEVDDSAPANADWILQYTWMSQVRAYVEEERLLQYQACTRVRLLATIVSRLVDEKIKAYDNLMEEHKRQAKLRSTRAETIVDTCECTFKFALHFANPFRWKRSIFRDRTFLLRRLRWGRI